jgi:hypothetical protein
MLHAPGDPILRFISASGTHPLERRFTTPHFNHSEGDFPYDRNVNSAILALSV